MPETPTKRAAAKATAATVQANDPDAEFWERLTAPFPADEIELLPKPFAKDSPRGTCDRPDRNGESCGGYHGLPAVHLSYVGHAGITTRLNEVCGPAGWNWEPYAETPEGLPGERNGGLWIRLTITTPSGKDVTKIGYGDAPGKSNATKELIGDALRNASMRFGVGTYLWSKSDRAKATLERGDAETQTGGGQESAGQENQAPEMPVWFQPLTDRISALNDDQRGWLLAEWQRRGWKALAFITAEQAEEADALVAMATGAEANPFG